MDEETDMLAGEYVLGLLDAAEAASLRLRAAAEPALAAAIAGWERRLAPLAATMPPIPPPPDLWPRIAASLEAPAQIVPLRPPGSAGRPWQRPRFWQATTAGALALAAALAAIAFLPPRAPPRQLLAALVQPGGPAAGYIVQATPDGALLVRQIGQVSVPADRDLELWALAEGATKPVSLGVLPPQGLRLANAAAARPLTQIMISLEPKGGSPTGAPTGPVLFAGTLRTG